MIRYDTIRKCFTVCKNLRQAGNSTQHWSTVVLPINTVAAAGAWILSDRRGDGRGRPARRRSAGGRCSLKSRVIQQDYCEYGHQTIAAVETLHSCYCLAAARPAGGDTAQVIGQ